MVDPTAWAGAKLPSLESTAATSIIDAYTKGQQQGLYRTAMQKSKREEAQAKELEGYRRSAVEFWKLKDNQGFMNQVSNMARIDPEAATKLKDMFGNLDKTNATMGAYHLYNAYVSDDPDAITSSLGKARDFFETGSAPIAADISAMMNQPVGSEAQDAEILKGIEVAKSMGLFPTEDGADDLARRRVEATEARLEFDRERAKKQEEYRISEQDRLKKKQEEDLAQRKLEAGLWTTPIYNDYINTVEEQHKAAGEYRKFSALAEDFERAKKEGILGGLPRWAINKSRDILGIQDKTSRLYAAWNYARTSEVINNLPRGPASDKDIRMVERGALDRNAKPEAIAQVIRAMAKLAKISDLYYSEKLKWMDTEDPENPRRGARGFGSYWKENGERLINEAGIKLDPLYPETEPPIDVTKTEIPKQMTQQDANTMILEAARAKGMDPTKTQMAVLPGGRVIYRNGDGWYYADDDSFYQRVR